MITSLGLSKFFEKDEQLVKAVDKLYFEISEGSIVALLGPNGAGKTTVVRMLSTIFAPTEGGAIVNGYDVITQSLQVRRSIGVLTESPSLYSRLTAERNLKFFSGLYELPLREEKRRISELLRFFGLEDSRNKPVGVFSKGMKQKLAIARALLHTPEILILDEPWSGLSPTATKELREYISNLSRDENSTILISTHNLAQVEQLVDNIIVINNGSKITEGSPSDLRNQYMDKSEIRVRFSEMPLAKDLENVKVIFTVSPETSSVLFEVPNFDDTPELIKQLISANLKIREVLEIIPSLEEAYIKMVGDQN